MGRKMIRSGTGLDELLYKAGKLGCNRRSSDHPTTGALVHAKTRH